MTTHAKSLRWALLGALPVVVVDQILKGLVTRFLVVGESHVLVPGCLHLYRSENPAAAFGLFGPLPPPVFAVLILAVLGVFLTLVWPCLRWRVGIVTTALVLGGALGNLADRVTRHYVVDYLLIPVQLRFGGRIYMWPVFNLADICVVIGIGLLVMLLFRREQPAPSPEVPSPQPGGNA